MTPPRLTAFHRRATGISNTCTSKLMATEIEHKYLVKDNSYKSLAVERHAISQGYLSRDPGRIVRVRIIDDHAVITIKGKGHGASRPEFEYDIPLDDARQLMTLCLPPVLSKTRHIVVHEGNRWEVDEFGGDLQGLTTAELEIPSEDYAFTLPPFVGKDVTGDPRYCNSQLGL